MHTAGKVSGNLNAGAGRDDVPLRDATEGNSVVLEGSSDQNEAGLELPEEDSTLAGETPTEKNDNRAGDEASAKLGHIAAHGGALSYHACGRDDFCAALDPHVVRPADKPPGLMRAGGLHDMSKRFDRMVKPMSVVCYLSLPRRREVNLDSTRWWGCDTMSATRKEVPLEVEGFGRLMIDLPRR